MADRDVRFWAGSVELRGEGAGPRSIDGYGALYNDEAVVLGLFREKFLPGALSESLRSDDILVTFNHDANQLLGKRSNQTASFTDDARGAQYSVQVNPLDPSAQSVLAKVQRRDVSGSSLIFVVERREDEEWTRDDPAKLPLRIIKRARVIEMGPVAMPVYLHTTAAARSQAESFEAADRAAAAAQALPPGEARASMTADQGEEAAELVQYETAASALTQAGAALATATTVVQELIADETESPTETPEAEAAEEELETARLRSLLVLCAQICGAVSGVSALAQAMLSDEYDPILYARQQATDDAERRAADAVVADADRVRRLKLVQLQRS